MLILGVFVEVRECESFCDVDEGELVFEGVLVLGVFVQVRDRFCGGCKRGVVGVIVLVCFIFLSFAGRASRFLFNSKCLCALSKR
jgi:hypothetical protein